MAQATSDLWKTLLQAKNTEREYGFDIDGVWYGPEAEVEHSVLSGLYEKFGIGHAAISQLSVSLYVDDIPRGATIKRYIRLVNGDQVSEWLPKGVFFTNRRVEDDGYWTVDAYDAMRKAEVVWEPDQALEFPLSMPDAVAEFARIMGIELDNRTALNAAYTIDYPANDYTIRQELCYIAAAHAGNWIITDAGQLRLVPLVSADLDSHVVGLDITGFENNGKNKPVSRLTLLVDDENCYTAGNDTGVEITADCPHATQAMADAVFAAVKDFQYQMYSADDANIDPAAELGDGISVSGVESVIARIDDDGSGYISVSAPGKAELEDEYPVSGPMTQAFDRKIAETRATITKTAEEISLKVDATDGRVSELRQTIDGFDFQVSQPIESGGQSYVRLTITMGGNTWSGVVKIDGNVDISGQLSAQALYAVLGDIAKLTVDSLSTSRRIPLYLARDTSDDNYISIADKSIQLIRAWTDGSSEQAVTPDGALLYWEQDISGASIGADGYPYADGARVFTTTEETAWPVMVYVYQEAPRRQIYFSDDETHAPLDVFGSGYGADDPDRGKGFIRKRTDGMDVYHINSQGRELGLMISDDYTDIAGLRKTKSLDFSGWDAGGFTEVIDGDLTEDYRVEFDGEGRPIKITDGDGHATTITW